VKLALRHRTSIRIGRRFVDGVLLATAVLALGLPASADARGLRLGFFDGAFMAGEGARAQAIGRTQAVGGTIIRLGATWSAIAPREPARPADPNDPAYQWGELDAAVREAVAARLTPIVMINSAPSWAEGPNRPSSAGQGTWHPDPQAFGQFARALASRYSGATGGLPRVRYWQIWNEPNLATYLTPQWVTVNGFRRAASPGIFRALVNAGYAGFKAIHRNNFVVTAGTGPYGDLLPGGRRIAPVTFLRGVLAKRTNFDAISHHPYGVGSPYQHALNPPDVAVPDIGKLRKVLRAAQKQGHANRKAQVWVTEMSWDSNPPDPDGVRERTQADWLQQGLNVLWRQGVSTVTWFQLADQGPPYPSSNQSGVFFIDGRPKLSATAFHFPFIASRPKAGKVSLWGCSPSKGRVVVEKRSGTSWRPIWSERLGRGAVFTGTGRAARGNILRARSASGILSLTWRVR
jgi:hypothetical protein